MGRFQVSLLVATGLATCLGLFPMLPVQAVDTTDTRLLSSPSVSERRIAFVYADDV